MQKELFETLRKMNFFMDIFKNYSKFSTAIFRTETLSFATKHQVCMYWRELFFELTLPSMWRFI